MERIVIEVEDETAKNWRLASAKYKKEISEKINEGINNVLKSNKKENFLAYLDELGDKMKGRGLTEESLNDILKGND